MVLLVTAFVLLILFFAYRSIWRVPAYHKLKWDERLLPTSSTIIHKGRFSAVSYNIAGLPQVISSAITPRPSSIALIGKKLNAFDIAHVQEDFNYNRQLYSEGNEHPFRTQPKGGVPFGDGLNTLSRFPIHELHRIPWTACSGADCLTPKGFTYSKIEVTKGIFIDFYNVHANAADDPGAIAARQKNILQLSEYIDKHSEGQAVIVMGDLNARFAYEHDRLRQLLEQHGLTDVWMQLKGDNKWPAFEAITKKNIMETDDTAESIDKILYRSSKQLKLIPDNYRIDKEFFTSEDALPLSDHWPVSVEFTWELLRDLPWSISGKKIS